MDQLASFPGPLPLGVYLLHATFDPLTCPTVLRLRSGREPGNEAIHVHVDQ